MQSTGGNPIYRTHENTCFILNVSLENEHEKVVEETSLFIEIR